MKRDRNKYPKGLSRDKVEAIIARYDAQSDDEAIAEADAAWENSRMTLVRVPNELVADVLAFVASRKKRTARGRKSA